MRLLVHTRLARCGALALASLAAVFLATSALAATDATETGPASLVRDINTTTPTYNSGSAPKNFANLGSITLFAAHDEFDGIELWKTDGTLTGTVMVKDIFPGVSGSTPAYLAAMNGFVYFQAGDGSHGFELWRSDGTPEGTTLVKDIRPGPGYSSPYRLTAVGNTHVLRRRRRRARLRAVEKRRHTRRHRACARYFHGNQLRRHAMRLVPGRAGCLRQRVVLPGGRRGAWRRVVEERRQRGGHGHGQGHLRRRADVPIEPGRVYGL